MSKRSSASLRAQALERLRAGEAAEVPLDDRNIFDEVDEATYKAHVQERIRAESFVEDDDGSGYADYGQDEWESESAPARRGDSVLGKRRAAGGSQAGATKKQPITSLFQRQAASGQGAPAPAPADDDSDIMASILNNLDKVLDDDAPRVKPVGLDATDAAVAREGVTVVKVKVEATAAAASPAAAPVGNPASETAPAPSSNNNQAEEDKMSDFDAVETALMEDALRTFEAAEKAQPSDETMLKEEPLAPMPEFCEDDLARHHQMQAATDAFAALANSDGELDEVQFYYYDAAERGGVVYLFGKVYFPAQQSYVSCAVSVRKLERNMFVLPRARNLIAGSDDEKAAFKAMYEELDAERRRAGIREWRARMVTRKYCFEYADVPAEGRYMKVCTPFSHQPLQVSSGRSFRHVFGTHTSALELLLLKRRLMGPSWLSVKRARVATTRQRETWAALELRIDGLKGLAVVAESESKPAPPLTTLSLQLYTSRGSDGASGADEIVLVAGRLHADVPIDGQSELETGAEKRGGGFAATFCLVGQPAGAVLPPGATAGATAFLRPWTTDAQALREKRGHNFCAWWQSTLAARRKGAADPQRSEEFAYTVGREAPLLQVLMGIVASVDPDVIMGHYLVDGLRETVFQRLRVHQLTSDATTLGRLVKMPSLGSGQSKGGMSGVVSHGRLWCDTYLAAQDTVHGSKSYSLQELCRTQLGGAELPVVDMDRVGGYFATAAQLHKLVYAGAVGASLVERLADTMQVLPLTRQLTSLAGNLWARTMRGARSERNEFLLLHSFHREKYVVPDKRPYQRGAAKSGARRKAQYAGGLVLEPKRGLHKQFVVLLDFNSLYPSIIQEYDVCFSTVERKGRPLPGSEAANAKEDETADDLLATGPRAAVAQPTGVLPRLLRSLVQRRRQVKALMKSAAPGSAHYAQLDVRQQALKLTANSMYGCLGAEMSRFYAKSLAMLITARGRELLDGTRQLAESQGHEVIYGDTDSIMIATHRDDAAEVRKLAQTFKDLVNRAHTVLEIDVDGYYRPMLLLQKKKYAAVEAKMPPPGSNAPATAGALITKGIDAVRRDWCDLSREASQYVLELIMDPARTDPVDDVASFLGELAATVRSGSVELEKFVVNKGLTKALSLYAERETLPHVKVALEMQARTGRPPRVGDTVPYVITTTGDPSRAADRARHRDEVLSSSGTLQVDIDWYLENQVLPPLVRLLQPIPDGLDEARLAGYLGLDTSHYARVRSAGGDDDGRYFYPGAVGGSRASLESRFAHAEKLRFRCPFCKHVQPWTGVVHDETPAVPAQSSFQCRNAPACGRAMPVTALRLQLRLALHALVMRYQLGHTKCREPLCGHVFAALSVVPRRCLEPACDGRVSQVVSAAHIDMQLEYLARLFDDARFLHEASDIARQRALPHLANGVSNDLRKLRELVDDFRARCAHQYVDLGALFGQLGIGALAGR